MRPGSGLIGSASLNGTITDATGGAVPGAKVAAHNTATGLVRNTHTTELGLYTFAGLPVGPVSPTPPARKWRATWACTAPT
jgi:protocatechuate 3,4-dioxygenase beta subunit